MKIFVTGASGLIGKEIVLKLLERKYQVEILINRRSETKISIDIAGAVDKIRCADIGEPADIDGLGDESPADVFIHSAGLAHQFAARRVEDFRTVNVHGTKNIAEYAVRRRAKHFIQISSVSVYGDCIESNDRLRNGIGESAACQPSGIYAQSKLEGEQIAREICGKNNIRLTILRLATVIGEDDRGNVSRLIEAIDRKRFFWIGGGDNLKSLIYKGDVAEACLKVLQESSERTEIYNVTAEPLKMKEIVSEIGRHLNVKIPSIKVPAGILNFIFAANRRTLNIKKINKLSQTVHKWLSDDVFSGAGIREKYGFQAQTSISEAIRREVESYRRRK